MKKEYVTFARSLQDLPEGKEIKLFIRDLTTGPRKYDARYVNAILSSSPHQLPNADVLWVRSSLGVLYPNPWAIKIMDEIGEYLPQPPYTDIFASKN